jgi:hypothetical protein
VYPFLTAEEILQKITHKAIEIVLR